jgi:intracellular multiplication protein IcmQ
MVYRPTIPLDEVEAIQKMLQECLDLPDWQKTNYLKLTHERLNSVSQELQEVIDRVNNQNTINTQEIRVEHPNQELVYVSIYSAVGKNLEAWERVILNLPRQYVSRPTYLNETDAQYAARFKGNLQNEAYVAIWVNKSDIISNIGVKDKFDRPLISLKDRAVSLKNIEYIWNSSVIYKWKNDHLVMDKQVPNLSAE